MGRLVVSPTVSCRWVDGQIELSSSESDRYHCIEDLALLEILHAFATPKSVESVLEEFADVESDDLLYNIAEFKASWVLVPEGVAQKLRETNKPHPISWAKADEVLGPRRRELEFLKYDDLGLTVSNCGKDRLSPGCQSCKDGGWLCFYSGFQCNAQCDFCPQPLGRRRRKTAADDGSYVENFLHFLTRESRRITGVSLSGGEIFLQLEIAEQVLPFVTEHLPHVYRWAYTNGIAATPSAMKRLRNAGLQELRFNLAATDFDQSVLKQVERAVDIFEWVTVEVPVTKKTHSQLVDHQQVSELAAMGVKQLNLAQLSIPGEASTPVRDAYGDSGRFYRAESFNPGSGGDLYSVESRLWAYDILEYAHDKQLNLRINDCSSEAKEAQRLARNVRWGPMVRAMKRATIPLPGSPLDLVTPPSEAQQSSTGLASKTLVAGHGSRRPLPDDYVIVHYTGWRADGEIFDSSYGRGEEGVIMSLATVIPGWLEALQSMVVGEKKRLWIPEELAFRGEAGRPPGMLVFDVELLDIL